MTVHVLILCTHNSARSVLAEAMLNHLAARLGKDVRGHSAGSAPSGRVNPLAIEVLTHAGVDTRAFELTRQALGYRLLQLLALPLAAMDRARLQAELDAIGMS